MNCATLSIKVQLCGKPAVEDTTLLSWSFAYELLGLYEQSFIIESEHRLTLQNVRAGCLFVLERALQLSTVDTQYWMSASIIQHSIAARGSCSIKAFRSSRGWRKAANVALRWDPPASQLSLTQLKQAVLYQVCLPSRAQMPICSIPSSCPSRKCRQAHADFIRRILCICPAVSDPGKLRHWRQQNGSGSQSKLATASCPSILDKGHLKH